MRFILLILTVLFVTLKLIGVIDWSWWLVLIPVYPSIIFTFLMGLLFMLVIQSRS